LSIFCRLSAVCFHWVNPSSTHWYFVYKVDGLSCHVRDHGRHNVVCTDWIVAAVVYAVMCACTVVCGSCKAVSNTYEAFLDISLEVKVTECILIFPDRRLKSDNM